MQVTHATPADVSLADELSALVNDVYAVAEAGMWVDGATRTSPDEMRSFLVAGELLLARIPAGRVVGSVRVHDVAPDTAEFGVLVAARDQRGVGVGRALLDVVEQDARDRGLAAMQLELLVPRDGTHPSKEFLASWYARRGYQLQQTVALEDHYPHLAPLLETPCELQLHRKPLTTSGRDEPMRFRPDRPLTEEHALAHLRPPSLERLTSLRSHQGDRDDKLADPHH